MLRVPSRLSEEVETLVRQTIGCGIAVHRELGPGLLEGIYARALRLELAAVGLPFQHERDIPVQYRGQLLCHQRLDLIVGNRVVVEIKSVDKLDPVHHAQLLSYLRVAGLNVGLLMDFNVPTLQEGLRRVVL